MENRAKDGLDGSIHGRDVAVPATTYWLPKIAGRMDNERAGKIFAWLTFIAFNATFFQMFFAGLAGMNPRIAIFPAYLQGQNLAISISASLLGPSFVLLAANLVSGALHGPRASDNPWGRKTLEWQTTSPPPHENFPVPPVITGDFYGYGDAGREPDTLPLPGRTREKVLEPTARKTDPSED